MSYICQVELILVPTLDSWMTLSESSSSGLPSIVSRELALFYDVFLYAKLNFLRKSTSAFGL